CKTSAILRRHAAAGATAERHSQGAGAGGARRFRHHGPHLTRRFDSGARRCNHEVMMRGTFANVRLRNLMLPGTEGGLAVHLPEKTETTIFDASMQYQKDGVPLMILAGKEYGSGSSRDWAAKGPRLLGIQAVLA